MKRLFVLALLSIACTTAFSQISPDSIRAMRDKMALNTGKYLTVKGIELKPELKMNDCLDLFISKGFKKAEDFDESKEQDGVYNIEGSFYDCDNCSVMIIPTSSNKNTVGSVLIYFPAQTSFKQLKKDYDELKSALSQKYRVVVSREGFDDDHVNETTSDDLKLSALEKDEGTFQTIFGLSEEETSLLLGEVAVQIEHITEDSETLYCVVLAYVTSDSIIENIFSKNDDL